MHAENVVYVDFVARVAVGSSPADGDGADPIEATKVVDLEAADAPPALSPPAAPLPAPAAPLSHALDRFTAGVADMAESQRSLHDGSVRLAELVRQMRDQTQAMAGATRDMAGALERLGTWFSDRRGRLAEAGQAARPEAR